jgi:hypothetical protein
MNANESKISPDVNWVDYCDALASEAWLESQKGSLLKRKPVSRMDLRDNGKSVLVFEEPSTVNEGG